MKNLKILSLITLSYPFFVYASCGIKPCDLIQCNPGFHCENGQCVPNPPPEDPCQNVTCDQFYKCVDGKCIASCEDYNCQVNFHCEVLDNKPTCVRDPIIDPCAGVACDPGYHCEKGNCISDIPVENVCPKILSENAVIYMNNKPYGNGFDATVRVKGDAEFCFLIHGSSINDCHLEGWPKREECEYYLLDNNCPVWEYMSNGTIYLCNDNHSAIASCDHFGNPAHRDDPQTPTTGDTLENLRGFEGEPKSCGLHRDSFGPYQGYFIIAHGIGQVRACRPDRDDKTCGPWKPFNH